MDRFFISYLAVGHETMWIDDQILLRCDEALALEVWLPREPLVVLGSSNQIKTECFAQRCAAEGVPVLKRYGGGGAVVLHRGCVIVSLGLWVEHPYRNDYYFRQINQALIAALSRSWPKLALLSQKGISDLAIGEKKIAGTSLFRSRNYLLFQASLLVSSELDLIERYLPHPSREPDYRQQKSHRQFLSCLQEIIPELDAEQVGEALKIHLPDSLLTLLQSELISPQKEQFAHIRKRAHHDFPSS